MKTVLLQTQIADLFEVGKLIPVRSSDRNHISTGF